MHGLLLRKVEAMRGGIVGGTAAKATQDACLHTAAAMTFYVRANIALSHDIQCHLARPSAVPVIMQEPTDAARSACQLQYDTY